MSLADKRGGSVKNLEHLLNQYTELFKQYLAGLDKLEEQLRSRWEPRLRQKEQQLRQQTGQAVRLTPERDPEFVKVLSDEIARIDAQYTQVLSQGKAEIRKLV
jgi:exonuclease VII large subunit